MWQRSSAACSRHHACPAAPKSSATTSRTALVSTAAAAAGAGAVQQSAAAAMACQHASCISIRRVCENIDGLLVSSCAGVVSTQQLARGVRVVCPPGLSTSRRPRARRPSSVPASLIELTRGPRDGSQFWHEQFDSDEATRAHAYVLVTESAGGRRDRRDTAGGHARTISQNCSATIRLEWSSSATMNEKASTATRSPVCSVVEDDQGRIVIMHW